jgi:hypothetical protein
MTAPSTAQAFTEAAQPAPKRRKAPPPVSVRLSWEEYDRLLHDAGTLSMAAYIRLSLFGEGEIAPHRKPYTRKRTSPSSELVMLAKMLGGLGQSEIAANLADIADAARIGALPVSPELEAEISVACEAVQEMRERLIMALGVKPRSTSAKASED